MSARMNERANGSMTEEWIKGWTKEGRKEGTKQERKAWAKAATGATEEVRTSNGSLIECLIRYVHSLKSAD